MSAVTVMSAAGRRRLFWAACGGMFVFGIVLAVLGVLFGLPEMRERIGVDLAQQGAIFLLLFFGVLVSTLITGPVFDSFGSKAVLASSAVIVTAALVAFSVSRSFIAAGVAAVALGFGGGGLNTAANALIADLYVDERGAMLNYLGMFFGFGALFIPLLAAVITGMLSISQLLLIAASMAGAAALAYILLPFPAPRESVGFSIFASIAASRRHPGVMLFAVLLFFQSGNESAIGGWTSTYIGSLGASAQVATWILAGYWAALMAGRLLSGRIVGAVGKERLVLMSGIGSALGAGILYMSRSLTMLAIGAVITGLSFAAIYPTTLAMAADRYQRNAGTIFGLLFAVGLIGGMLFPWALGHISHAAGVRAGMVLPLIGAVMITLLVIVISRQSRSRA
ncbi:MAG TPA: MFS transporter [Thermoanaerobaculia bacterium]|nr:MFS transporter [Thermoanaerobaculia bacterium]